jgi:uncharacterized protein
VRIENSFDVPAPPEAAWDLLMDVPRVIPCMPGAKLDKVVDDATWKATMQVKVGPVGLTFATDVKREEVDEAARRVKLAAKAREVRGTAATRTRRSSRRSRRTGASRTSMSSPSSRSRAPSPSTGGG